MGSSGVSDKHGGMAHEAEVVSGSSRSRADGGGAEALCEVEIFPTRTLVSPDYHKDPHLLNFGEG
jgi:hypothetical protein